MIDVSNLKDTLKTLGFIAYGDIYEKAFSEIGCSLKVDFQAKRLIYPNEIKGRERNDSFDQKENFVVFECVCRLLSKGYRPEHIELEKEWHLGHDAKGGRADICVSDTSGNMLRFLYKGIIIKHNKTEPTYTKTSLFLCEKRRFFMARTEKGVVATI